ncbi:acyl-CoA thioesterase [Noviherbaspirillum sp. ST9]|uniref:acyl-CoA thioesterase n=1 Tax=Noviherbaspirillum sp. ST9 TaxID=3401606 RepID=UPI003B5897F8
MTPSLDSFPRVDTLSARYGDRDADNLLSESALGRYIEQARSHAIIEILRECDIDLFDLRSEIGMLLAHTSVDILRHQAPANRIQLATGIARIGNSSVHLRVGVFCDGECLAVANNVLVFVARASGRPILLPESLRQRLHAARCA